MLYWQYWEGQGFNITTHTLHFTLLLAQWLFRDSIVTNHCSWLNRTVTVQNIFNVGQIYLSIISAILKDYMIH